MAYSPLVVMRAIHRFIGSLRFRPVLLRFAAAVFAIRAIVPIGYMPASLNDGGPFVLCHGTAAGALIRSLAEAQMPAAEMMHLDGHVPTHSSGHQHDADPDAMHEAWEHCPVGASFAAAAITYDVTVTLLNPGHSFDRSIREPIITATILSVYDARAPPSIFPSYVI